MIKIQDVIIWILFLLSVIIFFWYLFGNSPTFEQAILGIAITVLLTMSFKMGGFGVRLEILERRFGKLAHDFKGHIDEYHGK
jgi:high-affinity Fe2+/Pb2+ permease|tara:strand:- start:639 stop:884 length:246 start_codon:yes stop_codon:yes gene_type:complete